MLELLKTVGLVVLLGWAPWTGLSLLISWVFEIDFVIVYLTVGVLYIVALFGIVKWGVL